MFTKQHYKAIANIIWLMLDDYNTNKSGINLIDNIVKGLLIVVAQVFANYLELDNPNFDKHKFLKACGISDS